MLSRRELVIIDASKAAGLRSSGLRQALREQEDIH